MSPTPMAPGLGGRTEGRARLIPWRRWVVGLGLALGGASLLASPAGAGSLNASWTAPTTNSDGSPLADLVSFRVYYGTSTPPCPGSSFFQVPSSTPGPAPDQTVTFTLTGLSPHTLYYVSVTAFDMHGNESACSIPASAVARIGPVLVPTLSRWGTLGLIGLLAGLGLRAMRRRCS